MLRLLRACGLDLAGLEAPLDGRSLTHEAAKHGWPHVIHALREFGLPLNGRDVCGDTPLHVAAFFGQSECVAALIRGGDGRAAGEGWGGGRGDPPPELVSITKIREQWISQIPIS